MAKIAEICPYCGGTASVKDSILIYGRSYGNALICDNYPICKSYSTLYFEGKYMADAELRQLRKSCHDDYFDPLWKLHGYNRNKLYGALRRLLNLSKEDAHFGKLSKEHCRIVIESIKEKTFLLEWQK